MQTPEQQAWQTMADALYDGMEKIVLRLTEKVEQTRAEQAELRDEVHALANRIESVARSTRSNAAWPCGECGMLIYSDDRSGSVPYPIRNASNGELHTCRA